MQASLAVRSVHACASHAGAVTSILFELILLQEAMCGARDVPLDATLHGSRASSLLELTALEAISGGIRCDTELCPGSGCPEH